MRLLTSLFFLAMSLFFVPIALADHTTVLTSAIQKKYENMKSFSADFTQILNHLESGAEEHRTGSLVFQKPLRLRWETLKPHPELLVINDKEIWDYLPDEELAYRYSPEVAADSASVIRVVTGQSRLDEDFTVEAEPDEEGFAVLRLYPRDPSPQMVEAILWVDKIRKIIHRARILDFYGNTNELTFSKFRFDISPSSKTFTFVPPENITVEDLLGSTSPERPLLR